MKLLRIDGLLLAGLAVAVLAVDAAVAPYESPSVTEDDKGIDLTSVMYHNPLPQKKLLSEALRLVEDLNSAPSCDQAAALDLLNDCKSFEQGPDDAKVNPKDETVRVKQEYAARLAICELLGAKATIPRHCSLLEPSPKACSKSRFRSLFWGQGDQDRKPCYPEITQTQLNRCTNALSATPQHWTSYSNALQHAAIMCQASREAVDREKSITIYKNLAEAGAHIASSLHEVQRQVESWFKELMAERMAFLEEQMAFLKQLRQSQSQALEGMQSSQESVQESALSAVNSVNASIYSYTEMLARQIKLYTEDFSEHLDNIKTYNEENNRDREHSFEMMIKQTRQHVSTLVSEFEYQLSSTAQNMLASMQMIHDAEVNRTNALSRAIDAEANRTNALSLEIDAAKDKLSEHSQKVDDFTDRVFQKLRFTAGDATQQMAIGACLAAAAILLSTYKLKYKMFFWGLVGCCGLAHLSYLAFQLAWGMSPQLPNSYVLTCNYYFLFAFAFIIAWIALSQIRSMVLERRYNNSRAAVKPLQIEIRKNPAALYSRPRYLSEPPQSFRSTL